MDKLLQWLRLQEGGAGTYAQFRQQALALRTTEPEHAAMLRLLADLAGRFADAYDEERLPIEVSQRVLARLTGLVEKAVQIRSAESSQQIALLNEIGLAELKS